MPRRVGLPGAAELFRSTAPGAGSEQPKTASTESGQNPRDALAAPRRPADSPGEEPVQHTGRVRHDEKITVYVSSDELLALERLRLQLRAEHGIATDRGRIVRAALASALEQVREQGADADVVRRLTAT